MIITYEAQDTICTNPIVQSTQSGPKLCFILVLNSSIIPKKNLKIRQPRKLHFLYAQTSKLKKLDFFESIGLINLCPTQCVGAISSI